MKSTKDFRNAPNAGTVDTVRKAVKLEPIRKSGKEKHEIFKSLNGDDEDDVEDYKSLQKRESVLDYLGDEDEDFEDEDENFEEEEEGEEGEE